MNKGDKVWIRAQAAWGQYAHGGDRLLLFAKLQDYPQCQALANIWLRNRDNYTDAEYPHIVDIYVQRVMFPWKLHSLVPAFLDTCLGLDATQRQLMMQDYAVVIEKEIKTSTDEDDDKSPLPVKRLPISESDEGESEGVWAYIRRLSALLFRRIQPYNLTAILSVAFIILAFLSLRFNKGFKVQSYCCGND
uniref:Uncharacterized protein n=1 Tax=Magallana gigas TaxID=29159 RepID=K1RNJ7_MAGGI